MAIDSLHLSDGIDATHLDLTPEAAAERVAVQRTARGNLAAIMFERWGVDIATEAHSQHPASTLARAAVAQEQMVELLDALGLNGEAEHDPGTCRDCGSVLPMTAATSSPGAGLEMRIRCARCIAGQPGEVTAPAAAPPVPAVATVRPPGELDEAACRGYNPDWGSLWREGNHDGDANRGNSYAAWICRRACPVRVECYRWAESHLDQVGGGIWGGEAWVLPHGRYHGTARLSERGVLAVRPAAHVLAGAR